MKNRECPYCHETVSLKRCLKYLLKGTNYDTVCNHCSRKIKLAEEPKPGFKYSFLIGLLAIYLPMQICLLYFKTTFVEAILYSLPFVFVSIVAVACLTLHSIFFNGDI